MRWFKHYSDMHEGQSINNLMDEMHHTGLCFFLLQELCAQKLEQENIEKNEAVFTFHTRIVRQKLRISQVKLKSLLGHCRVNGLLSFEFRGNTLTIFMPILLELLDRDAKNARKTRAKHAQNTRLDIDKDKDKEYNAHFVNHAASNDAERISLSLAKKEIPKKPKLVAGDTTQDKFEWQSFFEEFWKKYPRKIGRRAAEKIYKREINNAQDHDKLIFSLEKYLRSIEDLKTQKQFVKYGSTFMNSWKDWFELEESVEEAEHLL